MVSTEGRAYLERKIEAHMRGVQSGTNVNIFTMKGASTLAHAFSEFAEQDKELSYLTFDEREEVFGCVYRRLMQEHIRRLKEQKDAPAR